MKVHELLSDPSKWTKQTYARDKEGYPCQFDSEKAVKWCVTGAMRKCYNYNPYPHYRPINEVSKKWSNDLYRETIIKLEIALQKLNIISIPHWNDYTDYQTVYNTLKELDI